MNRADRRLFNAQHRPAGTFQSEFRKRAMQRAYEARLRSQMTEEANGAPVPPEIAASMTKPRETEDLHQIGVTLKATGAVMFLGPMMGSDAIGMMAEQINRAILTGQRTDWTKAEAYPMTRIQELAA